MFDNSVFKIQYDKMSITVTYFTLEKSQIHISQSSDSSPDPCKKSFPTYTVLSCNTPEHRFIMTETESVSKALRRWFTQMTEKHFLT